MLRPCRITDPAGQVNRMPPDSMPAEPRGCRPARMRNRQPAIMGDPHSGFLEDSRNVGLRACGYREIRVCRPAGSWHCGSTDLRPCRTGGLRSNEFGGLPACGKAEPAGRVPAVLRAYATAWPFSCGPAGLRERRTTVLMLNGCANLSVDDHAALRLILSAALLPCASAGLLPYASAIFLVCRYGGSV